jgi:pyruvate dehydrogenase E1 component beta subunit
LLKTAIRDDNPVLVLESELLYNLTGPIEDKEVELLIPLGKGEIKREGADVTIICYAQTVRMALAAAQTLAEHGVHAEVLDLRSIKPLDLDMILKSVSKTHRCDRQQDKPFCGIGAELTYQIQCDIFDELDAPVARVAQKGSHAFERLEAAVLPSEERSAVYQVCYL